MINFVRDFCKENQVSKPIIACSAGIDSTCLAHICLQIQVIEGDFYPVIAHVSHQLRPEENEQEIKFIKTFSNSYILDGKVLKDSGLQERARKIRHKLLSNLAKKIKADCVFTAHTETDDLETIIMRLFQGRISFQKTNTSYQRVIYGVSPNSLIDQINFHKPFLCWSRQDVERYMKIFKLNWHEDSSNKSNIYMRNFIRNVIFPMMRERQ
jgi:tRNA(Ile)-lysidine synthase